MSACRKLDVPCEVSAREWPRCGNAVLVPCEPEPGGLLRRAGGVVGPAQTCASRGRIIAQRKRATVLAWSTLLCVSVVHVPLAARRERTRTAETARRSGAILVD